MAKFCWKINAWNAIAVQYAVFILRVSHVKCNWFLIVWLNDPNLTVSLRYYITCHMQKIIQGVRSVFSFSWKTFPCLFILHLSSVQYSIQSGIILLKCSHVLFFHLCICVFLLICNLVLLMIVCTLKKY